MRPCHVTFVELNGDVIQSCYIKSSSLLECLRTADWRGRSHSWCQSSSASSPGAVFAMGCLDKWKWFVSIWPWICVVFAEASFRNCARLVEPAEFMLQMCCLTRSILHLLKSYRKSHVVVHGGTYGYVGGGWLVVWYAARATLLCLFAVSRQADWTQCSIYAIFILHSAI